MMNDPIAGPVSSITPMAPMTAFIIIVVCTVVLICVLSALCKCEINLSSSMPEGVYYQSNKKLVQRGDYVKVCLPEEVAKAGIRSHYISRGPCSNDSTPLIKEVIAVPGDKVEVTDEFIVVNGEPYYAPVHNVDHNGNYIQRFIQNGLFKNTKQYWLYGLNNKDLSWDSRYFGGVDAKNIMGIYKLL